jgi:hypothetical protein
MILEASNALALYLPSTCRAGRSFPETAMDGTRDLYPLPWFKGERCAARFRVPGGNIEGIYTFTSISLYDEAKLNNMFTTWKFTIYCWSGNPPTQEAIIQRVIFW